MSKIEDDDHVNLMHGSSYALDDPLIKLNIDIIHIWLTPEPELEGFSSLVN